MTMAQVLLVAQPLSWAPIAQTRLGAWALAAFAWPAEVQFGRQPMAQARVLAAQPLSWEP